MQGQEHWVVICCHEDGAPPEEVHVRHDYDEALLAAGEYWQAHDLGFDPKRDCPFYVDPESGYDEVMDTGKNSDGLLTFVRHADGYGCVIHIMQEDHR